MAATREKRSNAGNRMSQLLNDEEGVEEFYETTYGGFKDLEDDNDYKYNSFPTRFTANNRNDNLITSGTTSVSVDLKAK